MNKWSCVDLFDGPSLRVKPRVDHEAAAAEHLHRQAADELERVRVAPEVLTEALTVQTPPFDERTVDGVPTGGLGHTIEAEGVEEQEGGTREERVSTIDAPINRRE